VDFPRTDRCSDEAWGCAIEAALAARKRSGRPVAMVATLPENMPEAVSRRLIAEGVTPLMGVDDALGAAEAAARLGNPPPTAPPVALRSATVQSETILEADAKVLLSDAGVPVPRFLRAVGADHAAEQAKQIGFPVVLKGEGICHKTEAGAVALGLNTPEAVRDAAADMAAKTFLVEEMVTGVVAELLVGVVHDPAHGFVLTLAAGGTLTELLRDSQSLLVPSSEATVACALNRLKVASLLNGYRGGPAADMPAILTVIAEVQNFVLAQADSLEEIEINPLLCGPASAVAADVLVRIGKDAA